MERFVKFTGPAASTNLLMTPVMGITDAPVAKAKPKVHSRKNSKAKSLASDVVTCNQCKMEKPVTESGKIGRPGSENFRSKQSNCLNGRCHTMRKRHGEALAGWLDHTQEERAAFSRDASTLVDKALLEKMQCSIKLSKTAKQVSYSDGGNDHELLSVLATRGWTESQLKNLEATGDKMWDAGAGDWRYAVMCFKVGYKTEDETARTSTWQPKAKQPKTEEKPQTEKVKTPKADTSEDEDDDDDDDSEKSSSSKDEKKHKKEQKCSSFRSNKKKKAKKVSKKEMRQRKKASALTKQASKIVTRLAPLQIGFTNAVAKRLTTDVAPLIPGYLQSESEEAISKINAASAYWNEVNNREREPTLDNKHIYDKILADAKIWGELLHSLTTSIDLAKQRLARQ